MEKGLRRLWGPGDNSAAKGGHSAAAAGAAIPPQGDHCAARRMNWYAVADAGSQFRRRLVCDSRQPIGIALSPQARS